MDEIESLLDDINAQLRVVSREGDVMTTTTFFEIINRLAKAARLDDHIAMQCNLSSVGGTGWSEQFFVLEQKTVPKYQQIQRFSGFELFSNRCDKNYVCRDVQSGTDASIDDVRVRRQLYTISRNRDLHYTAKIIPKTSDANAGKLTSRELEVLKWAKDGKSYWETSIIMVISERTVKFHLCNIYRKLNVVNRSQAIAVAVAYGYLRDADSSVER